MMRLISIRYLFQNSFKAKPAINQRFVPLSVTPVLFNRSYSASGFEYKPYALLRTFESTPDSLTIQFQDGLVADYYYVWLRDSCRCEKCIDIETFKRKVDTVSLNLSIAPTQWHMTGDGKLKILWPDLEEEHTSYYEPSWLYRYGLGFNRNVYEAVHDFLPPSKYWNSEYLEENLPEIEYEEVMQSFTGINKFLLNIHELGIVILRNVPCKTGEINNVMSRISHSEHTKWVSLCDIVIDDNSCKLNQELCINQDYNLHTDMNYLEKSPAVKVIHCLERKGKTDSKNIVEENWRKFYFVDGFYVAQWLKGNYPLYFKTLTDVPLKFKSISKSQFYINYQPMLTLNKSRCVTEVHFNNEMRAPLEGPSNSILTFYAAYKVFGENIKKSENQFSITLRPGDAIFLNNRRVLHGNKGSDTSSVTTYLEACYCDMDDMLARYRSFCKMKQINMY